MSTINYKSVSISPSSIKTGDQFVISIEVEAVGFSWGELARTTWSVLKKYTWGKLRGGS